MVISDRHLYGSPGTVRGGGGGGGGSIHNWRKFDSPDAVGWE